jgi:hypothetical protein
MIIGVSHLCLTSSWFIMVSIKLRFVSWMKSTGAFKISPICNVEERRAEVK